MTEIMKDLKFGRVKTLITKKLLNKESKGLFIKNMLDHHENNIWYHEPLKKYEMLYVAIIPNKRSVLKDYYNETYKTNIKAAVIVSYILVKRTKDAYYIELTETDTHFRGLGINTYLINHFIKFYKLNETNKKIVPLLPIKVSIDYWIKFFETHFKVFNKFKLQKIRKQFIESNLNWKNIYDHYDNIYNHFVNSRMVKIELDEVYRTIKMKMKFDLNT